MEAEVLFHQDPRWLGADGALSVPLARDRTLWLFGDTFIATSNANLRTESEMVRNTVAIQRGNDPRSSTITFHWRQDSDGTPASFFPESRELWYWPGHGIRLKEGPLVIFLYEIANTPGEGLGFATSGYAVAVIDDPSTSPDKWTPRLFEAPPRAFDAVPATAVIRDRDYIIAVAVRQEGTHAGALVRFAAAKLAQGDISHAEWWAGETRG